MANKALLVGINKYPDAPLVNCVNDIKDAATLTVNKGIFETKDIRLLADRRATTSEIKEHLAWVLDGANPGDKRLFYYSGHGTPFPVRDDSGNVASNECAICPVDFDWDISHVITASDFAKMFSDIPEGVTVQVVCDSCFSGDLFRSVHFGTPRSYPMPADMQWRVATADRLSIQSLTIGQALEASKHENLAYLSGCKEDQTSSDGVGIHNGAFTYHLLKRLETDGLAVPLTELRRLVNADLDESGYPQDPELHGNPAMWQRGFLQGGAA
jgi:hypothetical protein